MARLNNQLSGVSEMAALTMRNSSMSLDLTQQHEAERAAKRAHGKNLDKCRQTFIDGVPCSKLTATGSQSNSAIVRLKNKKVMFTGNKAKPITSYEIANCDDIVCSTGTDSVIINAFKPPITVLFEKGSDRAAFLRLRDALIVEAEGRQPVGPTKEAVELQHQLVVRNGNDVSSKMQEALKKCRITPVISADVSNRTVADHTFVNGLFEHLEVKKDAVMFPAFALAALCGIGQRESNKLDKEANKAIGEDTIVTNLRLMLFNQKLLVRRQGYVILTSKVSAAYAVFCDGQQVD
jgi:hypothetical protein